MKKFKENELKSLDQVVGGKKGDIHICIKISGVLDGIKGNTDFGGGH